MSNIIKNSKKDLGYDLNNMRSEDVASVFKSLIESKKEYEITKEIEQTKRYEIEQKTKSYLEAIKSHQTLMEETLSKQFNQRKEVIDKMFEYVDKALESDKDEIVVAALNNITEIVKTPVQGFTAMKQAFGSDDDLVI